MNIHSHSSAVQWTQDANKKEEAVEEKGLHTWPVEARDSQRCLSPMAWLLSGALCGLVNSVSSSLASGVAPISLHVTDPWPSGHLTNLCLLGTSVVVVYYHL